jgi:hypothetical protein
MCCCVYSEWDFLKNAIVDTKELTTVQVSACVTGTAATNQQW